MVLHQSCYEEKKERVLTYWTRVLHIHLLLDLHTLTHATMNKLIVVCSCMYHTLYSMSTSICSFALLMLMLWFCVYHKQPQLDVNSVRPAFAIWQPVFHAMTACDTVSRFARLGKETAWSTWKSLPGLADALLMLAGEPKEILDNAMNIIERFHTSFWPN